MQNLSKFINISARCGSLYHLEKLSPYDLNGVGAIILLHLCRNPGVTQEALAKNVFVNKSNIARHISKLMENGYVERKPDEADRRALLVYPTDKAREVTVKIREVFNEWNGILTADLTDEEKEILEKLLERLCHKAKSYTLSSRGDEKN